MCKLVSTSTKGKTLKLTEQQAKQVLEYFVQKAAEDAPDTTDWQVWDKSMWMTCYQASIAIERQIKEQDWVSLVNYQLDLQSFDRDPDGYLHERGYTEKDKDYMHDTLKDLVSWGIDTVLKNSGA